MTQFSFLRRSLTILSSASLTLSAQGAILAYDGFDVTEYVAGGGYAPPVYGDQSSSNALVHDTDLTPNNGGETGQNPPTYGFSGPWANLQGINSNIYARLQNSQLAYTGLNTTNGQLTVGRDTSTASNKTFERTVSIGNSTNYTNTLYIAGLIQPSASTAFGVRFTYQDGRYFEFNVDDSNLTSLGSNATSPADNTASGLWTANSVNFFVLKLENSVLNATNGYEGDQLTLFINPDLSSEASNTAALQYGDSTSSFYVVGNGGFEINSMRLSASPGAAKSVTFDELKIATTWGDLANTVVPEPSTSLLGLAGIALLLRRKR